MYRRRHLRRRWRRHPRLLQRRSPSSRPCSAASPRPPWTRPQARAAGSTELAVAVLDRGTGELAVGEPRQRALLRRVAVEAGGHRRRAGPAAPRGTRGDRRRPGAVRAGAGTERRQRDERDLGPLRRAGRRRPCPPTAGPLGDHARRSGPGSGARSRSPRRTTSGCGSTCSTRCRPTTATCSSGIWPRRRRLARDGFDQAFGLLAPSVREGDGPGAVAKQGWMCCFSGPLLPAQRRSRGSGPAGSSSCC